MTTLGGVDIDGFIRDGYTVVRGAVPQPVVDACQDLTRAAVEARGVRPGEPATWPPVLQLGNLSTGRPGDPFAAAGTAPALTAAYDALVGPGRWDPPRVGDALVVRFPSQDRGNAGYHIEGSYPGPDGRDLWVNVRSKARGLLALFLFSDVGDDDAPTRLVRGSHLAVPEFLVPHGSAGTSSDAVLWRESVLCRPVVHATGRAGDVFLCHPFMVHTATWPHEGVTPRVVAQPAVHVAEGFALDGTDPSPVARAIVAGLR